MAFCTKKILHSWIGNSLFQGPSKFQVQNMSFSRVLKVGHIVIPSYPQIHLHKLRTISLMIFYKWSYGPLLIICDGAWNSPFLGANISTPKCRNLPKLLLKWMSENIKTPPGEILRFDSLCGSLWRFEHSFFPSKSPTWNWKNRTGQPKKAPKHRAPPIAISKTEYHFDFAVCWRAAK